MARTADELEARIADQVKELTADEMEIVLGLVEGLLKACDSRFAEGRELGRAESTTALQRAFAEVGT